MTNEDINRIHFRDFCRSCKTYKVQPWLSRTKKPENKVWLGTLLVMLLELKSKFLKPVKKK